MPTHLPQIMSEYHAMAAIARSKMIVKCLVQKNHMFLFVFEGGGLLLEALCSFCRLVGEARAVLKNPFVLGVRVHNLLVRALATRIMASGEHRVAATSSIQQ